MAKIVFDNILNLFWQIIYVLGQMIIAYNQTIW